MLKYINVLKALVSRMSLSEKSVLYVGLFVFIGTIAFAAYEANHKILAVIPRKGGTINEGFINSPRFINPVLAVSETDRELVSLVYTGLTRINDNGDIVPAIAESVDINADGTEYIFKIREDAVFHDSRSVLAEDVLFTIQTVQNPAFKSPRRAQWEGVTVEALGEREVKFTLSKPYAAFLTSTRLGILPKHIWQSISPDELPYSTFNINPIGSGPYQIDSVELNSSGIPEFIGLSSFSKFVLGEPYITHFNARFYGSDEERISALRNGDISSLAGIGNQIATDLVAQDYTLRSSTLGRIFALFLNQNEAPVLAHREIRQALSESVDKQAIVDQVLDGFGTITNSPIPEFALDKITSLVGEEPAAQAQPTADILATLAKGGWVIGADGILTKTTKAGGEKLIFSIYTSDNPELKQTAEILQNTWKSIGAQVDVKVFEPGQFSNTVIRGRDYDSLLFGITISRDLDFYSFWHSSERNDPGLNIALYTNAKADKLLESARTLVSSAERSEAQRKFALEVINDVPAIFLYSPHFIYVVPPKLKGYNEKRLRAPGDRFYDIYKWYTETDSVWGFFKPNENRN